MTYILRPETFVLTITFDKTDGFVLTFVRFYMHFYNKFFYCCKKT